MIQTTLDDLLRHQQRVSAYDSLMMTEARLAGHVGAGRAVQKCAPDFVPRAKKFVLAYLDKRNSAPGEIIVDLCKQAGIVAPDDRAFGVVFAALSRAGEIRCIGYCDRKKGHSTAGGRIWALVRY